MKFVIEEIWIEQEAEKEPLTGEIVGKLPHAKVLTGPAASEAERSLALETDPLKRGKRILKLVKHKGTFIKPCPGTPEYICCGLQILHVGQGCPMDCRYCALQVYFNRSVLEVFVNVDDLLDELSRNLRVTPKGFQRFCTGEFTDSLALDPLTNITKRLVSFFSDVANAALEIKTKTDLIAPLLETIPRGQIVLSFSVNSRYISQKEEIRTASLERRLAAAARAEQTGYKLGFHFDPIIPHVGWEQAYTQTIDDIFSVVQMKAVVWISLGVLRFVPQLKDKVISRFNEIHYFHDGFIRGLDGKSRLHVDRRIAIYRTLASRIKQHSRTTRIYLCMESPYVWEKGLDIKMDSSESLKAFMNQVFS